MKPHPQIRPNKTFCVSMGIVVWLLTSCLPMPNNQSLLSVSTISVTRDTKIETPTLEAESEFLEEHNYGNPDLPSFILAVSPKPNSIVSKTVFLQGEGFPFFPIMDGDLVVPKEYQSSICVDLYLFTLVETGDHWLNEEDIGERVQLTINGESYFYPTAIFFKSALFLRGQIEHPEASWGGPDHILCWEVDLEAGEHEVLFEFQQTSGKIRSFAWTFTIVE